MADPGYTPDPAAREAIHAILWEAVWKEAGMDRLDADTATWLNVGLKRGIDALAATGRLADPNAETRTEWASEHSGHGAANFPDPLIFETGSDRRLAEVRVETWRASHPPATHRLLSRQVTTTRGPWLPAPTDTEES